MLLLTFNCKNSDRNVLYIFDLYFVRTDLNLVEYFSWYQVIQRIEIMFPLRNIIDFYKYQYHEILYINTSLKYLRF